MNISLEGHDPADHPDLVFTFSTKTCYAHRGDCTNPDGHLGQTRLGTRRAPHVQVSCQASKLTMSSRIEAHLVKRYAQGCFPSVRNVYWHEPSVYEAVDENDAFVVYILLPGAPESFMRGTAQWRFYNPKPT